MKHSQTIGILAVIVLAVLCFFPWIHIPGREITVTGFSSEGTRFGKPGLFHMVFSVLMLICFLLPAIWAKRTNVFLAALNLAWSFRNYLLLSACFMGECPEKKPALYGIVLLALLIQVMSLLPKVKLPAQKA
jgi:hypothetical protein